MFNIVTRGKKLQTDRLPERDTKILSISNTLYSEIRFICERKNQYLSHLYESCIYATYYNQNTETGIFKSPT